MMPVQKKKIKSYFWYQKGYQHKCHFCNDKIKKNDIFWKLNGVQHTRIFNNYDIIVDSLYSCDNENCFEQFNDIVSMDDEGLIYFWYIISI